MTFDSMARRVSMDENRDQNAQTALDPMSGSGNAATDSRGEQVTTRLLPAGIETKFKLPGNAPLSEVLKQGAQLSGVTLLPPAPSATLDGLHNLGKDGEVGPGIADLDQSLHASLNEQ